MHCHFTRAVSRRTRVVALAAACWCAAEGASRAQPPAYTERVTVARVAIDVHVLHDDGSPVRGLTASDFAVRVDGRLVPVVSARWTTEAVADRDAPAEPGAAAPAARADRFGLPDGRQIVVLIQKDLEPTRMEGLMGLLQRTRAFVAGLEADDQVAVMSFDWRLSLWIDFTRDKSALDRLFERDLLMGSPPAAVPVTTSPTVALYFDRAAARRASSMEQALLVAARALARVPGAKSLVVLGHGFGRLGLAGVQGLPTTVSFDREYREARGLFLSGRTAVYCLDTTRAATHSLDAGLQQVAADTGGFFLRTHEFPAAALRRLGDALAGRYELSIEKPPLPAGEHHLSVGVTTRKALVLHRRSYVG